jgi:hypothetical protein
MKRFRFTILALVAGVSTFSGMAVAAVISSGTYDVGLNTHGALFDGLGTGFRRNADGYDPLAPGTPRDSWGLAASDGSMAYSDPFYYGDFGILGTISGGSGSDWTTSTLSLTNGSVLNQHFFFAADNVIRIDINLFNIGATRSFTYQRDVDWDVDPTYFAEYSDNPVPMNDVLESSYYGFEAPVGPFSSGAAGTYLGDLGGGITMDLGVIGAGQSRSMSYYYAISREGQTPLDLRAQVAALGGDYSVLSWDSFDGRNSALIGVHSTLPDCVPEPASMVALSLGGLAMVRRRRQAK